MTGDDLRQARLVRGWSQRDLARRAGLTPRAVQYWEGKPEVDQRAPAAQAIARAFGWLATVFPAQYAPARGRVLADDTFLRLYEAALARMRAAEEARRARRRVICGAKTRKGTPCRAKSEPGRQRCRFHGGKSTGPKTAAGRERIAEAQRRR